MAQLPLTNVITISVSQAQTGVGNYNTSNLAIFTDELPGETFGTAGFSSYLSPAQVGIDFGTGSKTYAMANAIFSQQPNILTGGGQLVVILLNVAVQTLAFSGVAASGTFVLNFNSHASTAINWNDTASQIQGKLQAVTGLAEVTVTGSRGISGTVVLEFQTKTFEGSVKIPFVQPDVATLVEVASYLKKHVPGDKYILTCFPTTVGKWWRRIARDCKFRWVNPHNFKHGYATRGAQNLQTLYQGNPHFLQWCCLHSSYDTTQRYIDEVGGALLDAFRS